MRASTATDVLEPTEIELGTGFVSIAEAASLAGVDRQDVEAMLLQGVIRAVVTDELGKPTQWLIPMDEVVLLHLEAVSSWPALDSDADVKGRPELSAAVRAVVARAPKPSAERSERIAALLGARVR